MTDWKSIYARERSTGRIAIHPALAAYHVHALAFGIDKHVVGVAADLGPAQSLSRCHVKRLHARGTPEDCKHSMVSRVDGKRVVGLQFIRRPVPDRSVGFSGEDLNRSRIRDVHEYSRAVRFELKTLGMTFEWNIGDAFARGGVDDRDRAVIMAHIDAPRLRIHAYVVRVCSKIEGADCRKIRAAEQPQGSIAAIGNVDRVCRGFVADTLRLIETGHRAQQAALLQVDDSDAVVAQFRDVQSLAS